MSIPDPPLSSGAYTITVKDVYDKLTAVADQLAVMTGHLMSIDTRNKAADAVHADLESRIRKLEAWRYALPLTGLLALVSIALAVMSAFHR